MEGVYLAVGMVAIYLIFGPLVLMGIYILFDKLGEKEPDLTPVNQDKEKNFALWTNRDAEVYLRQQRYVQED